jgi:hypothetical protein
VETRNLGEALQFEIETRDQDNALFDPAILQVTIVKPDGTEDKLELYGLDPRDNRLSRVSIGLYRAYYPADAGGIWTCRARWKTVINGEDLWIHSKPELDEGSILVVATGAKYVDG